MHEPFLFSAKLKTCWALWSSLCHSFHIPQHSTADALDVTKTKEDIISVPGHLFCATQLISDVFKPQKSPVKSIFHLINEQTTLSKLHKFTLLMVTEQNFECKTGGQPCLCSSHFPHQPKPKSEDVVAVKSGSTPLRSWWKPGRRRWSHLPESGASTLHRASSQLPET